MDRATLRAFMASQRYGVLSSLSPQGTPQSALVGISISPALEIIFDTLNATRKYRNLIAQPACSFVIGGWSREQTMQLEGRAFQPQGTELDHFREVYFHDWPDGRERVHWPGLVHLVVRPVWIRYSDFDQRPPFILESSIEDLL